MTDFIDKYLDYVGESESPIIYHRWAILSAIGAMLGRQVYFPFGHSNIYPNQYILLMGTAGARKNAPLTITKDLLKAAGYKRFAPAKTSKEALLVDMQQKVSQDVDLQDLEHLTMDRIDEIYVSKGEFIDFLGINDVGFMSLLTDLWDNLPEYDNPKVTRKNVRVEKPTISILGGATPTNISLAIPQEALESGFMSRIILVFSEPTGIHITFPEKPSKEKQLSLVEDIKEILETCKGEITLTEESKKILDKIYKTFHPLKDGRFSKYMARRFTHLLKLCMIIAVMDKRMEITEEDCIRANTYLYSAEVRMPKALGEFGRSKFSEVSNIIMEHLNHSIKAVTQNELWKLVHKDLTKPADLTDLMRNLVMADKVQVITDQKTKKQGYLPKTVVEDIWDSPLLNINFLTPQERI